MHWFVIKGAAEVGYVFFFFQVAFWSRGWLFNGWLSLLFLIDNKKEELLGGPFEFYWMRSWCDYRRIFFHTKFYQKAIKKRISIPHTLGHTQHAFWLATGSWWSNQRSRSESQFIWIPALVRTFVSLFFVLFFEIRGRNKNRRSRWVGRPNFIGRRSLDGVAPVCGASRARRADSRCAFVRFLRYVAPSMFVHPFVRPFANSDALPDAQPARFRRHFVFRSRFRFFCFYFFSETRLNSPFPLFSYK